MRKKDLNLRNLLFRNSQSNGLNYFDGGVINISTGFTLPKTEIRIWFSNVAIRQAHFVSQLNANGDRDYTMSLSIKEIAETRQKLEKLEGK
jgi:hypothetical protein